MTVFYTQANIWYTTIVSWN